MSHFGTTLASHFGTTLIPFWHQSHFGTTPYDSSVLTSSYTIFNHFPFMDQAAFLQRLQCAYRCVSSATAGFADVINRSPETTLLLLAESLNKSINKKLIPLQVKFLTHPRLNVYISELRCHILFLRKNLLVSNLVLVRLEPFDKPLADVLKHQL